MLKLSTTRLPSDHFVSGALFGGMGALALELSSKDQFSTKRVAKFALEAGIATSLSISASNKIANKNYFGAAMDTALGVGAILLINTVLNEN